MFLNEFDIQNIASFAIHATLVAMLQVSHLWYKSVTVYRNIYINDTVNIAIQRIYDIHAKYLDLIHTRAMYISFVVDDMIMSLAYIYTRKQIKHCICRYMWRYLGNVTNVASETVRNIKITKRLCYQNVYMAILCMIDDPEYCDSKDIVLNKFQLEDLVNIHRYTNLPYGAISIIIYNIFGKRINKEQLRALIWITNCTVATQYDKVNKFIDEGLNDYTRTLMYMINDLNDRDSVLTAGMMALYVEHIPDINYLNYIVDACKLAMHYGYRTEMLAYEGLNIILFSALTENMIFCRSMKHYIDVERIPISVTISKIYHITEYSPEKDVINILYSGKYDKYLSLFIDVYTLPNIEYLCQGYADIELSTLKPILIYNTDSDN